jgi:hypothetical protein
MVTRLDTHWVVRGRTSQLFGRGYTVWSGTVLPNLAIRTGWVRVSTMRPGGVWVFFTMCPGGIRWHLGILPRICPGCAQLFSLEFVQVMTEYFTPIHLGFIWVFCIQFVRVVSGFFHQNSSGLRPGQVFLIQFVRVASGFTL